MAFLALCQSALPNFALADTGRSADATGGWLTQGWSVAGFAGPLTNNNTSEIFTGPSP